MGALISKLSSFYNAVVKISDVILPFEVHVTKVGTKLPRHIHKGPPGNLLPTSELYLTVFDSSNATQIPCPIIFIDNSLVAKMIIHIAGPLVVAVSPIRVNQPSL